MSTKSRQLLRDLMHKLHGFELKWAPSANAPRRPIPGGKWVRNPVFGWIVKTSASEAPTMKPRSRKAPERLGDNDGEQPHKRVPGVYNATLSEYHVGPPKRP